MATKAKTISTRAIAIAAVGAVALGGVQATAPANSVLAAGVTEATAQTAFSTKDVTYNGLFKQDGTKITGPIRSIGTSAADGEAVTAGTPAYISLKVDLANVAPGDTLNVSTSTRYTIPGENTPSTSAGSFGIGFASSEPNIPVMATVEGVETQIGTLTTRERSTATVRFNDNVQNVRTGSIDLKLNVKTSAINTVGEGKDSVITGSSDINVKTPGSEGYEKVGSVAVVNMFHTFVQGAFDRGAYVYTGPSYGNITQDGTVHVRQTRVYTPGGTNGTATFSPSRDKSLPNFTPWVLEDNVDVTPVLFVYPEGTTSAADAEKFEGMEEINAKFSGVRTSINQNGQTLTMSASGVPKNAQMTYVIKGPGGTGDYALASYLPNGYLYGNLSYKDNKTGDTTDLNGLRAYSVPGVLNNLPGGVGDGFTRTADVTPSIAGQPKGAGIDTPAPIAGQDATFLFQVKNTGNSALAAPVVTLPNGKRVVVKDTAIKPGTTGTVSVKYKVPKDANNLNFNVEFAGATLNPSDDFNFSIGKSSPLAGDVTVNPDGTITIQTPDGPITLAPIDKVNEAKKEAEDAKKAADKANERATQLEKDLAAEKARNDADRQKIAELEKDLAQAKKDAKDAADKAQKAADKAQREVDALEKVVSDLKADQAADREKIAGLEKQLQDAKDALKRAQDTATAAQNAATAAQNTANQALKDLAKERERIDDLTEDLAKERERVNDLTKRANQTEKDLKDARERVAALEKENDAQQKQIDQARKDVEDLQGKTKQLRTDLEAAKKRVTALEEQNKKQQGQIDALVKENKTQQSQIDALKKQNGEQQKQIDGLKAGLRDANKKITALETDLALTKIELAEVSGRLAEVEDRLNTGLGKCVGTIGGSLAALVPAVILASQFTGGTNIPQVDNSIAQFQRQLGMFNPQLAQVVDQNRGAIAAGLAGLGLLSLVLLPGTCGDASLGEAAVEPLSSARAERKAARENGEGGSSLKAGADVAAGNGAGSSEQNQ